MRIDKYLKLSRLIKRRTVAQEMAEVGAVRICGRQCKPASEVKCGDVVEIAYPRRILTIKVETAEEQELKHGVPAYSVVEEKEADKSERPW
ncbi:MAG: RNA-binding S4 domain-containing protein [Cloacibacillus sp.]